MIRTFLAQAKSILTLYAISAPYLVYDVGLGLYPFCAYMYIRMYLNTPMHKDISCINISELLPQELLALLDHLDKERKGYVHVDEFVQGLQSMRTSASVTTSSPPSFILGPVPNGKPQRYNDKV